LKLFPAEAASPEVVKAQRAVLPKEAPLVVVGGITPEKMAPYFAAGADGFGLGGAVYKPGPKRRGSLRAGTRFAAALADRERA
jgi:2-dehydro-3-deoxyphosphogalactonate aldolase